MAKLGTRKCASCDRFVDPEDGGSYVEWGSQKGRFLCGACAREDVNDPIVTVLLINEGERSTYRVGGFRLENEWGDGFYQAPKVVQEFVRSVEYYRSDAWRGCWDGEPPKGWVEVIHTWVGMDGYNLEGDLKGFQDRFQKRGETPDFPMIVAFPRSSNVCVIQVRVYVPEEVEAEFLAWIGSEVFEEV